MNAMAKLALIVAKAIELQKAKGFKGANLQYSGINNAGRLLGFQLPWLAVADLPEFEVVRRRGGSFVYVRGEAPQPDPNASAKKLMELAGVTV